MSKHDVERDRVTRGIQKRVNVEPPATQRRCHFINVALDICVIDPRMNGHHCSCLKRKHAVDTKWQLFVTEPEYNFGQI